jgi:hypothetical protein
MDVDPGNMSNHSHFNPLTKEEKQKLHKTGGCFKCREKGHMARFCPTKQNGSTKYGRPAPTQQACSGVTDTAEETKKGVSDVLKEVKACLTSKDAKQKFFDGLVAEGFV